MVGRKNSLLVTKRSLRNAESGSGKRPRRIVPPKLLDDTVGMSRREEQELNKALYASLYDSRRSKSLPSLTSLEIQGGTGYFSGNSSNGNSTNSSSSCGSSGVNGSSSSSVRSIGGGTRASSTKTGVLTLGKRRAARTGHPPPKRFFRRSDSAVQRSKSSSNLISSSSTSKRMSSENLAVDESSQDSVKSSSSSANGSKKKIHAQRKFAQGCSLPGTPTCMPAKPSTPPVKLLSHAPKTEDFLTFLCLRGSSVLPPHLDFFNFSREELPLRSESAKGDLCGSRGKRIRETIPDENSSTSSGANEEIAEAAVTTPNMTIKSVNSLSKRSAARASAGTPETARGIVSLRQGLQRKVSSSSSSSSSSPHLRVSSPSRTVPDTSHTNTPPCLYKPKFYFIPEKASLSEASGVLPGEFTPPSKAHHMSKHSPLIYRPSPSELGPRSSSSRTNVSSCSSSSSHSSVRSSPSGAGKRKRVSTFFSSRTGCQVTDCWPAFSHCLAVQKHIRLAQQQASLLSPSSVSPSPPLSSPSSPSQRSDSSFFSSSSSPCPSLPIPDLLPSSPESSSVPSYASQTNSVCLCSHENHCHCQDTHCMKKPLTELREPLKGSFSYDSFSESSSPYHTHFDSSKFDFPHTLSHTPFPSISSASPTPLQSAHHDDPSQSDLAIPSFEVNNPGQESNLILSQGPSQKFSSSSVSQSSTPSPHFFALHGYDPSLSSMHVDCLCSKLHSSHPSVNCMMCNPTNKFSQCVCGSSCSANDNYQQRFPGNIACSEDNNTEMSNTIEDVDNNDIHVCSESDENIKELGDNINEKADKAFPCETWEEGNDYSSKGLASLARGEADAIRPTVSRRIGVCETNVSCSIFEKGKRKNAKDAKEMRKVQRAKMGRDKFCPCKSKSMGMIPKLRIKLLKDNKAVIKKSRKSKTCKDHFKPEDFEEEFIRMLEADQATSTSLASRDEILRRDYDSPETSLHVKSFHAQGTSKSEESSEKDLETRRKRLISRRKMKLLDSSQFLPDPGLYQTIIDPDEHDRDDIYCAKRPSPLQTFAAENSFMLTAFNPVLESENEFSTAYDSDNTFASTSYDCHPLLPMSDSDGNEDISIQYETNKYKENSKSSSLHAKEKINSNQNNSSYALESKEKKIMSAKSSHVFEPNVTMSSLSKEVEKVTKNLQFETQDESLPSYSLLMPLYSAQELPPKEGQWQELLRKGEQFSIEERHFLRQNEERQPLMQNEEGQPLKQNEERQSWKTNEERQYPKQNLGEKISVQNEERQFLRQNKESQSWKEEEAGQSMKDNEDRQFYNENAYRQSMKQNEERQSLKPKKDRQCLKQSGEKQSPRESEAIQSLKENGEGQSSKEIKERQSVKQIRERQCLDKRGEAQSLEENIGGQSLTEKRERHIVIENVGTDISPNQPLKEKREERRCEQSLFTRSEVPTTTKYKDSEVLSTNVNVDDSSKRARCQDLEQTIATTNEFANEKASKSCKCYTDCCCDSTLSDHDCHAKHQCINKLDISVSNGKSVEMTSSSSHLPSVSVITSMCHGRGKAVSSGAFGRSCLGIPSSPTVMINFTIPSDHKSNTCNDSGQNLNFGYLSSEASKATEAKSYTSSIETAKQYKNRSSSFDEYKEHDEINILSSPTDEGDRGNESGMVKLNKLHHSSSHSQKKYLKCNFQGETDGVACNLTDSCTQTESHGNSSVTVNCSKLHTNAESDLSNSSNPLFQKECVTKKKDIKYGETNSNEALNIGKVSVSSSSNIFKEETIVLDDDDDLELIKDGSKIVLKKEDVSTVSDFQEDSSQDSYPLDLSIQSTRKFEDVCDEPSTSTISKETNASGDVFISSFHNNQSKTIHKRFSPQDANSEPIRTCSLSSDQVFSLLQTNRNSVYHVINKQLEEPTDFDSFAKARTKSFQNDSCNEVRSSGSNGNWNERQEENNCSLLKHNGSVNGKDISLDTKGNCKETSNLTKDSRKSESTTLNDVTLHSFGSLCTGQGYTFVHGQPQECEILNRNTCYMKQNGQNPIVPSIGSSCSKKEGISSTIPLMKADVEGRSKGMNKKRLQKGNKVIEKLGIKTLRKEKSVSQIESETRLKGDAIPKQKQTGMSENTIKLKKLGSRSFDNGLSILSLRRPLLLQQQRASFDDTLIRGNGNPQCTRGVNFLLNSDAKKTGQELYNGDDFNRKTSCSDSQQMSSQIPKIDFEQGHPFLLSEEIFPQSKTDFQPQNFSFRKCHEEMSLGPKFDVWRQSNDRNLTKSSSCNTANIQNDLKNLYSKSRERNSGSESKRAILHSEAFTNIKNSDERFSLPVHLVENVSSNCGGEGKCERLNMAAKNSPALVSSKANFDSSCNPPSSKNEKKTCIETVMTNLNNILLADLARTKPIGNSVRTSTSSDISVTSIPHSVRESQVCKPLVEGVTEYATGFKKENRFPIIKSENLQNETNYCMSSTPVDLTREGIYGESDLKTDDGLLDLSLPMPYDSDLCLPDKSTLDNTNTIFQQSGTEQQKQTNHLTMNDMLFGGLEDLEQNTLLPQTFYAEGNLASNLNPSSFRHLMNSDVLNTYNPSSELNYIAGGEDVNILDVIMEELKEQIHHLRQEIERDSMSTISGEFSST